MEYALSGPSINSIKSVEILSERKRFVVFKGGGGRVNEIPWDNSRCQETEYSLEKNITA